MASRATQEEEAATAKDVAELKEAIAPKADETPFDAEEGDGPKVSLAKDDDEETPAEREAPQDEAGRRERRRERGEFKRRAEAAEQRSAELEAQVRAAETRAAVASEMQRQMRQPDMDPMAQMRGQLDGVFEEQRRLHEAYTAVSARGLTEGQQREFYDRAKNLEIQKAQLLYHMNHAQTPQADPKAGVREFIKAKYNDVFANPRALGLANAAWTRLQAEHTRADGSVDQSYDTEANLDTVMQTARRESGLTSGRPKPDAATRARYAGIPRGGGSPGGSEPQNIVMNGTFRKMARAFMPHATSDKQAFEAWARGPGREALRDLASK